MVLVGHQRAATEGGPTTGVPVSLEGVALVGEGGATADLVSMPGRTGGVEEGWGEFGYVVGHRTWGLLLGWYFVNFMGLMLSQPQQSHRRRRVTQRLLRGVWDLLD